MATHLRFSIHDLEHLPDDNEKRYEIIDGELFVSRAMHYRHQMTCDTLVTALRNWITLTGHGVLISQAGLIFADDNAVIPDLVWLRTERSTRVLGDDGKLHAAPDLAVEILSSGLANEARDLKIKLDLYSRQGVREYWIIDWRDVTVRVYRRENAALQLVATLDAEDSLESPLLPGFALGVAEMCANVG